MSERPSKRMALLAAYEDFTRKEGVCIREENWDQLPKIQAKKAKVIEQFQQLDETASETEDAEFKSRISVLQRLEAEHSKELEKKMADNRQAYRRLSVNVVSAGKLRRVYGSPKSTEPTPSSLKGRA